mmetsp:Transcript_20316/g.45920  ORF Transcript_20316/g.45920 Transcript_20316/m.45920 type:complete len:115 (-) Transcript_20316:272-616(-)|eukprot:CAMPEP_0172604450 /NCGR_PEP_ID=MMETSP1068-20121228/24702_1 /TAXON_ID=35684 /ORGANISM="Pseudopedinella elastica, Strain CCMP716" /LENGTH=114 /DNA_ID=CAMNT_0013406517 /DNA_START=42 /DNA_END=386 /DNA_ORIENTATION=-
MGRRKATQKKIKKKRPEVAKKFKCLFCNHENAVECELNHKEKIGSLKCRICGEGWQTRINYLSEPIDVFSEWLDATEAEADVEAEERPAHRQRTGAGPTDDLDDYDGGEAADLL